MERPCALCGTSMTEEDKENSTILFGLEFSVCPECAIPYEDDLKTEETKIDTKREESIY